MYGGGLVFQQIKLYTNYINNAKIQTLMQNIYSLHDEQPTSANEMLTP